VADLKNYKVDANIKKEKEKKKKEKQMIINIKSEIFYVHAPSNHGGNIKVNNQTLMKLVMSQLI